MCVYKHEKGKNVSLGYTFKMHETEMTELTQGENYTYLGQDEDVGYNDSLKKRELLVNTLRGYERYGNLTYTATINQCTQYFCYPRDHSYICNTPMDKRRNRKNRCEDTQNTLSKWKFPCKY